MVIEINPQSIAACSPPSALDLRQALIDGRVSAQALLQAQLAAAANSPQAFIRLFETEARAQALACDQARAAGLPPGPLSGLTVSVKDLFDVAGHPATGGSVVLDGRHSALTGQPAEATTDAPAVARLRAAGAVLIGHTNLSEFAFSGMGLNPHHGTPANPVTACVDATPRLPGGSTSGGAVSVAIGAAWAALGSDTGGSIRIPAALQGLVGFKSSQSAVPLEGCIPLSPTLDTACALTADVASAAHLHGVLSGTWPPALPGRPLCATRLALPRTLMLDALEPEVSRAFERSLAELSRAGARIETIDLPELGELASLQAQLSFAATESWAWHRARLQSDGERYDPRVAARMRRGEGASAADYLQLHAARRDWIARVSHRLAGFDAALSPTVPSVAPPLAPLLTDDTLFFATNAALLRNPSAINFLDGCALSLPCQRPGDVPVGLMLWSTRGRDLPVLDTGLQIEAALKAARGEH